MQNRRVLFVDDEQPVLEAIKRIFRKENYDIFLISNPVEAIDRLTVINPAVVVSDQLMPEMYGHVFLEKVRIRFPAAIRILMTAFSDFETTISAINKGYIYRYISKPWNRTELIMGVKNAVNSYNLTAGNQEMVAIIKKQNEYLMKFNSTLEKRLRTLKDDMVMHAKGDGKSAGEFLSKMDDIIRDLAERRSFHAPPNPPSTTFRI